MFDAFPGRFLAHHPGYARVRPALSPLVLPQDTADAVWAATRDSLRVLTSVLRYRLRVAPEKTLEALGYSGTQATWLRSMHTPANLALASAFARADFVLGVEGPRLVEMNVGPTVGGLGILDRYAEEFESVAADVTNCFGVRPPALLRPGRAWARCLLKIAGPRLGDRRRARLALVVADDEVDVPHPHEAARYLRREGIEAEVVKVNEIHLDGTATRTAHGPVDLVYGCFTFDQFSTVRYRRFVDAALAAEAAGGPRYLSPPLFTLLGNKALLALATEGGDEAQSLPLLVARTVIASGVALDRAHEDRDRLVLKPAVGYGGKDVVIGRQCSPDLWSAALARIVAEGRRHVLQEYVAPSPVDFSSDRGPASYEIGLGCLCLGGRLGGFLVRHVPTGSTGPINVSRGATFSGACVLPKAELARWRPEKRL